MTTELPDALLIEDADIPPDVTPDALPEYPCHHCGFSLTYGGKGRKPKHCTPDNGGDPNCPT